MKQNTLADFDKTAIYDREMAPLVDQLYAAAERHGLHMQLFVNVGQKGAISEIAHTQVLDESACNLLKGIAILAQEPEMAASVIAAWERQLLIDAVPGTLQ